MFRLVDRPFIMPGRTLTGQTVGPVIDTEVILRNGGRVYLHELEVAECVRHMPHLAERLAGERGWLTPETHRSEIAKKDSVIADLEGRLAELAPVERAMNRAAERFASDSRAGRHHNFDDE